MKKNINILIALTMMVILTGCFKDNDVAEELIEYHNDHWLTYHKMKNNKKDNEMLVVTTSLLEHDIQEVVTFYKEEILQDISKLIDYLENIELEKKEVQRLNQLQLDAEKAKYNMYDELIDSIAKEEDEKIEIMVMNFYIKDNESDKILDEFYEERDKLMKKYNVQWQKDNDGEELMKKTGK